MFYVENIYIIGFGQIGKSIANTLRKNSFVGNIFACNSRKNSEEIINCKYINGEYNVLDNKNDIQNSIIFVCTPPSKTIEKLNILTNKFGDNKNIIISDVCSVKNEIFNRGNILNFENFISIHPMDSGSYNNEDNFFKKNILNFIIQTKQSNQNVISGYILFLEKYLNFKNILISYEEHDKMVAIISHLAKLIFCCFNNNTGILNNQMWKEIFKQNQKNINIFLNDFIECCATQNQKNICEIYQQFITKYNIVIEDGLQNPSLKRVLNLRYKYNDLFLLNLRKYYNSLVS